MDANLNLSRDFELVSIERKLLVTLAFILLIGVTLVFSSSYMLAKEYFGSSHYFFVKQIIFILVGSSIAFVVSKTKITFWYKYSLFFHLVAGVLVLLSLGGPFSMAIKGSTRWLKIGGFSMQPGEYLKITSMLASFYLFENFMHFDRNKKIIYSLLFLSPLIFLMIQPDFGTFGICITLTCVACYLSAFNRKIFYSLLFVFLGITVTLAFSAPYRVKRILAFLDPWADPQNAGFQIIQSFLAFAHGKLFGQGIGNSNEKLFYLPEAYNDFIFSVAGEELGFIGVFFIVMLYLSFLFFGFKLGLKHQNKLSKTIIVLIIFSLGFQAFLNMGVVLGLLPTKGLNLPFISYGGSSILGNFILIGLLISAGRLKYEFSYSKKAENKGIKGHFSENIKVL